MQEDGFGVVEFAGDGLLFGLVGGWGGVVVFEQDQR